MFKAVQLKVPSLSLRRMDSRLDPAGNRIVHGVSNMYPTSKGHGYGASTHEAGFSGGRHPEVVVVTRANPCERVDLCVSDPGIR
jgi:hypothetical protein